MLKRDWKYPQLLNCTCWSLPLGINDPKWLELTTFLKDYYRTYFPGFSMLSGGFYQTEDVKNYLSQFFEE